MCLHHARRWGEKVGMVDSPSVGFQGLQEARAGEAHSPLEVALTAFCALPHEWPGLPETPLCRPPQVPTSQEDSRSCNYSSEPVAHTRKRAALDTFTLWLRDACVYPGHF